MKNDKYNTYFFFFSVIGEEGEADLQKIKSDFLTSNQDETVLNHYKDRLPSNIQDAKIEDLTVWVDPLDGTKEFTEGYLDHVTVLVGIAIGKKAIGGVIHQPFWNYEGKFFRKIDFTKIFRENDFTENTSTVFGIIKVVVGVT